MAKSAIDVEKIKGKYALARKKAIESGAVNERMLKAQKENDLRIAEVRGLILNRTAELEHQLNHFIAWYFTYNERRAVSLYDALLTKEFFTLHQKIVLFGEIGYHKRKDFGGRFDGLSAQLHKVKEMRNLLAHGHKASATEPLIRMLSQNEPTRLDDQFMAQFKLSFEAAFFSLVELNEHIRSIDKGTG